MHADEEAKSPRALRPPQGPLIVVDEALIARAIAESRVGERRRVILPLHKSAKDALQRMLNALQPGSYIRPHRHREPPKAESIVLLRGRLRYVTFDDAGRCRQALTLEPGGAVGVDIEPGVYHTFFALEEDTVLFEVKPGPYDPATDKDFADWAPPEGHPEASVYLKELADKTEKTVQRTT